MFLQEDLAQTKQQLEELEEQNNSLNDIIDDVRGENFKLREEKDAANKELSAVRNRLNLAQQNWNQEKDELINAERYTKEDYEAARQAMQDWEVIAMEERSVRESLSGRVVELEELLVSQKTAYDQISSEYEKQESTMSGLQRALQEIQEGFYCTNSIE
jgi:chromosome segregation ATPase